MIRVLILYKKINSQYNLKTFKILKRFFVFNNCDYLYLLVTIFRDVVSALMKLLKISFS